MPLEYRSETDTEQANRNLPGSKPADRETMLVKAARDGDPAAFRELFDTYGRQILRLAQNITQNREDAEDVAQEAFLNAFLHRDTFRGDSRFYTWVARIAVNEALMKMRKRLPSMVALDEQIETEGGRFHHEIKDWSPTPEQCYSGQELRRILAEAIGKLDPDLRIVFHLRDVEQVWTISARILGLAIPAVKSRLLRARLKLRHKLNPAFQGRETYGIIEEKALPFLSRNGRRLGDKQTRTGLGQLAAIYSR